jgi:hypothetical protein
MAGLSNRLSAYSLAEEDEPQEPSESSTDDGDATQQAS